jgi:hypothetical protein
MDDEQWVEDPDKWDTKRESEVKTEEPGATPEDNFFDIDETPQQKQMREMKEADEAKWDESTFDYQKLITDNPNLNVEESIVDYLKAVGLTPEGWEVVEFQEFRKTLAEKLWIKD